MKEFFRIVEIIPLKDNILEIGYSDGGTYRTDFKKVIIKGGIFKSLKDPKFFAMARIGRRGRSVEWPGGIDFCADALRLKGEPFREPDQKTLAKRDRSIKETD